MDLIGLIKENGLFYKKTKSSASFNMYRLDLRCLGDFMELVYVEDDNYKELFLICYAGRINLLNNINLTIDEDKHQMYLIKENKLDEGVNLANKYLDKILLNKKLEKKLEIKETKEKRLKI